MKAKIATLAIATILLSGCAQDDGGPKEHRARGMTIAQYGLFNISSNNTLSEPPESRRDERFFQTTRLSLK